MINASTLTYYPKLVEIRLFLEKEMPSFPIWKCETTSRLVQKIVGLDILAGEYIKYTKGINDHVWNWDQERKLHIDLTMCQFDRHTGLVTPSIAVLPEMNDYLLVKPESIERIKQDQNGECEKAAKMYYKKFLNLNL